MSSVDVSIHKTFYHFESRHAEDRSHDLPMRPSRRSLTAPPKLCRSASLVSAERVQTRSSSPKDVPHQSSTKCLDRLCESHVVRSESWKDESQLPSLLHSRSQARSSIAGHSGPAHMLPKQQQDFSASGLTPGQPRQALRLADLTPLLNMPCLAMYGCGVSHVHATIVLAPRVV